jgi:hypothetical protein
MLIVKLNLKIKDFGFMIDNITTDCDTLICINTCEKDTDELNHLKNSEFYKKLKETNGIGIIEVYRGSTKTKFEKGKLFLNGEEQYDQLHVKTYQMINWCVENLTFNRLVKLDCNFLTYNSVGERTRKRICGVERVENTIYRKKFKQYLGSSGRPFLYRDLRAWLKQRGIELDLGQPNWLIDGMNYFCGKCYRIDYKLAKFIASSDKCKLILNQHNIQDENGNYPYAVEDVMVGRMYEAFLQNSNEEPNNTSHTKQITQHIKSNTKNIEIKKPQIKQLDKKIQTINVNKNNNKIKAYQIYYTESQKDKLMSNFTPYFNNKATVNLESGVISDLVKSEEILNCNYFGVFSWKASQKINNFNFEQMQEKVNSNLDCDIIAPNPKNYIHCARRIKSEHTIRFGKHKFMDGFNLLIKKLKLSENPSTFMLQKQKMIYFNYFIAKPEIYKHFVDTILDPVITLFQEDSEMNKMGYLPEKYKKQVPPVSFTQDTGLSYYPKIPFLLERLINVYIYVNDVKVGYVL